MDETTGATNDAASLWLHRLQLGQLGQLSSRKWRASQSPKPSIVKELEIKHSNGNSPFFNVKPPFTGFYVKPRLITGWYMDVCMVAAVLPEISCEKLSPLRKLI